MRSPKRRSFSRISSAVLVHLNGLLLWGDGGFGEGLLGWLDATEAGALADALAAYDLSPNAPSPERYDEYSRQHELPPARALVGKLRDQARRCGERGLGVLLRRD